MQLRLLHKRFSCKFEQQIVPFEDKIRRDSFSCKLEQQIVPSKDKIRRDSLVYYYHPPTRDRTRARTRARARDNKRDSKMIMDVVEASNVRSQARWGAPLAVSVEALLVLLVTALVVQLKYSYVVPRVLLVLSRAVSFLLHKPAESDQFSDAREQRSEALHELKIYSLDNESARRKARYTYRKRIYDVLRIVPDEDVVGLKITENYEENSRGVQIFTKSWIPETGTPKAAICFCHGYGDTVTYFFETIARKLASKNFAVFGMDYAGFGLSEGLHGWIPSFDELVADVAEHFSSIKKREEFEGLPFFLLGESMGGAVALKAHWSMPNAWDGAILVAPMCKIAEAMYPPKFMIEFLKLLAKFIPKAKLVPSGDIAEIGFQDPEKRLRANQNMISYIGKPRLGTALSLLNATISIGEQLDNVSLPLLILHGAADRVTDPTVSQDLYRRASNPDKTLNMYENTWHAVLEGESDESIDRSIDDIVTWLDARS